ncbi:MAG TPA: ABC transporter substrate-binding protein, partial [Microbacterium sp.]|uniref:ABC transporter substrate-binding protein n=1 Tax=Microbacterium sp. TaxID=51671 RepID=UPI002B494ECB
MHITTKRALTVTAVGVTAALALAGCSAGAKNAGSSNPSTGLVVTTPAAAGTVDHITWNVFEGEPQTVDPYHSADYTPNMINSNMCENLLAQTPDFQIKPNLAQSYSNPDPLTWVYDIRPGVTFWDGHPLTADDVVYSLDKNWKDPTSFYNYLYANVASITKTGPLQVTVKLKAPDYLFNDELSATAGVIVEKDFTEKAGKNFGSPSGGLMCTGPYKFGGWTQGQSITAVAYDGYWNKALKPKVKKITFTFLTDDSAITSGLLSGEIDGTYNVPVSGIPTLSKTSTGSLYRGKAGLEVEFVVANQKGALKNADIRKALQLAIDWKGIGATVYGGEGTPTSLQMASASFGFAKTPLDALAKQVNTTDGGPQIAKAKALLKDVPAAELQQQISLVVPQQA